MKTNLLLYLCLLSLTYSDFVFGQTPEMTWAFGLGSSNNEDIHSVIVDQEGNVIITGGFYQTIDFDPGQNIWNLTSSGDMDIYIAKYDPNGNLIWAQSLGGPAEDFGRCVRIDHSNNIYLTGHFESSVDFDASSNVEELSSEGAEDIYVLKLSPEGTYVWASSFGGSNTDMGYIAYPSQDGSVYVTGAYMSIVDFDNGIQADIRTAQERDIYLLKLDSEGNYEWVYTAGGSNWDYGNWIEPIGNSVYFGGAFRNVVEFDPNSSETTSSIGGVDSFMAKLSTDGNFEWVKTIGGISDDYVWFTRNTEGNFVGGGWFKQSCDFDPSSGVNMITSNGNADALICEYDISFSPIWVKNIGGTGPEYGQGIVVDGNNNCYLSGLYEGTVDFDPSVDESVQVSNGYQDMFVAKFTTEGEFVWSYSTGSDENDYSYTTAVSPDDEVYVGGWVGASLDFDQGDDEIYYEHVNGHDIALFKLETICPDLTTTQEVELCPGESYSIGNSTYTHEGVYEDKFISVMGCDSIVVTILAYTQILDTLVQTGDTLSSITSGATFQWLDCNQNFAEILGANEQEYVVASNGSFAVEITLNGCVDTTDCVNMFISTIDEIQQSVFTLNPIPFAEYLDFRNQEDCQLTVWTCDGKIVHQKFYPKGTNRIQTSDWASGVYLVSIKDNLRVQTKAIMKE